MCAEAVVRTIKTFCNQSIPNEWEIIRPNVSENLEITIEQSVKPIRPYIRAAVLENIKFDDVF